MISRRDALKLGAAGLAIPALSIASCALTPVRAQDSGTNVTAWRGNAGRTGEMPGPAPSMDKPINIKWVVEHNSYYTGAIVVAGRVVIFGSKDHFVYAVDASTGMPKWRFETGGDASFSPALDDSTVYAPSEDGVLYAVDIESGEERWRYTDSSWELVSAFSAGHRHATSPIVSDGLVFIDSKNGVLSAIDAATGSQIWRFDTGVLEAPPSAGNGAVLVMTSQFISIDKATGNELWRLEGAISETPVVVGDIAYLAFHIDADNWGLKAVDTVSGKSVWQNNLLGNVTVADGTVYSLFSNGLDTLLAACDASSGDIQWEIAISEFISDYAIVEKTLYLFGNRKLLAIDAKSGAEVWNAPVTISLYNGSVPPAVIDGTLFIPNNANDDGRIFAIGNPDPTVVIADATIRETPSNNSRETGSAKVGDVLDWVGDIEEHRGQKWIDIRIGTAEGWILLEAIDISTLPDSDAFDFRFWSDPQN